MQKFSTVELLRDIKTVTMAADRQPVTITQHRKPRYVLMTYDEFESMKTGAILDVPMAPTKHHRNWSTLSCPKSIA